MFDRFHSKTHCRKVWLDKNGSQRRASCTIGSVARSSKFMQHLVDSKHFYIWLKLLATLCPGPHGLLHGLQLLHLETAHSGSSARKFVFPWRPRLFGSGNVIFWHLLVFYRISQNSMKSRFLNWNSIKLETLRIQKLFRCQKVTQHCSSIDRGQIPYLRLFCCPGICRNTPPGHSNLRSRSCFSQGSGSTCPTSAMIIFSFANSKLFGIMKL